MIFWLARWQGIADAQRDDELPSVLAIQESDKGHIIIRSPEVSKTGSP